MSHSRALIGFWAIALISSVGFARVDAVYTVPTVAPGLAAAATFEARSDQDAYGAPEATGIMRFMLPSELTGLETEFELKRQADNSWSGIGSDGSKVEGACGRGGSDEEKKWFSCTVKFDGLKIDTVSRDVTLEKVFGRGFEFDQRSLVARHFEGQPIGVIKVRLRCD